MAPFMLLSALEFPPFCCFLLRTCFGGLGPAAIRFLYVLADYELTQYDDWFCPARLGPSRRPVCLRPISPALLSPKLCSRWPRYGHWPRPLLCVFWPTTTDVTAYSPLVLKVVKVSSCVRSYPNRGTSSPPVTPVP